MNSCREVLDAGHSIVNQPFGIWATDNELLSGLRLFEKPLGLPAFQLGFGDTAIFCAAISLSRRDLRKNSRLRDTFPRCY